MCAKLRWLSKHIYNLASAGIRRSAYIIRLYSRHNKHYRTRDATTLTYFVQAMLNVG